MKKIYLLILVSLFIPSLSHAHQPRIVESRQINVIDPEISKAYYGKLAGESDVYTIESAEPFDLYVGVLVPNISGQKKDVSAVILHDGKAVALLDGTKFEWTQFFEEFGHDTYWEGPEYKARAEAGKYEITVSSSNNDSKYSLAIGEIEAFDFAETVNALTLIPQLKKNFFDGSPIDFILSPFGYGLIIIMYVLSIIFGLLYRTILRRLARNSNRGLSKNIGKSDRIVRFIIGIVLLLFAIMTTWNPIILFFSGFALFESIFSWCGLYAAMGKTTCPIE